jgi:hypothetical protein
MPLALSGLWTTIIVVFAFGGLALAGYAIWQMRSEEGWQERPPRPPGE